MIPTLVRFHPVAQATKGLEDRWPGSQLVADGVGLVTMGFLSTEGWGMSQQVTTSWTNFYSTPSTTWTLIATW